MTIRNMIISQILSKPARFTLTAVVSTMALVSVNAYANNTLTAMSATQTTNQTTQLRLDFSEVPLTPKAYQLDNPKRLVLDFDTVNNGLPNRYNSINQGAISEVTTLDSDESTRLIIGLNGLSDKEFATTINGNSLLVDIVDTNSSLQPAYDITSSSLPVILPSTPVPEISKPAPLDKTMVVRVNPLLNPAQASQGSQTFSYDGLTGVNYVGNAAGGGSVNIGLVNESIPVDIQRQGNKIVVRMTSAMVPSHLKRQQNINGSLVSSISAHNNGKNGLVSIAMSDDFEYKAYQSGNSVNIEVTPPKLLREPTLEEKQYSGEPISVDFQNVEIRSVLHLLSQFTDMNIVASDNVTGNITLNLINVPWDQALDIILKSKNLGMRTNGNVILVAPANTLAEQEAKELEAQQLVKDLSPLRTEYIRLSYANAENVLKLISDGRNATNNNSSNKESGSLLSSRGTVTIDNRTNTLIIKDTSESIANIRALIEKIDIPVRQVMIEARIVKATDNFSKEIGVKWGILSNGIANNRDLLVGGSDQTLWDLKQVEYETDTINGQKISYPSYTIERPSNLNVDLGVDNAAGRIAFGLLSMSDLMIDLELSAMQADGRGEVISTPKVLTMDKQKARVSSGTQIPYQEASASGATTTAFVEAALSLEVTPNITPDGKISLELVIENGSPETYNGAVAISKDSITTNVLVEDGQTIVLGGIFRNRVSEGVEKVPFLGDLPYIGKLFRSDVRSNNKDELLIFVTPRLLTDGVSRIN